MGAAGCHGCLQRLAGEAMKPLSNFALARSLAALVPAFLTTAIVSHWFYNWLVPADWCVLAAIAWLLAAFEQGRVRKVLRMDRGTRRLLHDLGASRNVVVLPPPHLRVLDSVYDNSWLKEMK